MVLLVVLRLVVLLLGVAVLVVVLVVLVVLVLVVLVLVVLVLVVLVLVTESVAEAVASQLHSHVYRVPWRAQGSRKRAWMRTSRTTWS